VYEIGYISGFSIYYAFDGNDTNFANAMDAFIETNL
jgi:hypothetical protein